MEGRRKVDGFRGVWEEVVDGRRVFVPVLKVFGEQLDLGSHPTAQDAAMVGAQRLPALAAVPATTGPLRPRQPLCRHSAHGSCRAGTVVARPQAYDICKLHAALFHGRDEDKLEEEVKLNNSVDMYLHNVGAGALGGASAGGAARHACRLAWRRAAARGVAAKLRWDTTNCCASPTLGPAARLPAGGVHQLAGERQRAGVC